MNHLTDSQLNEYLDRALDTSVQSLIEIHIAACSTCRARLAELEQLASILERLPEAEPTRDLTTSILANLPQSQPSLWNRSFAAQLGATLGMVLYIVMEIAPSIRVPSLSGFQIPIYTSRFAMPELSFFIQIPNLEALFSIHRLSFAIPQLPSLPLPLSISEISMIALLSVMLGSIGNIILLRGRPEVRK